MKPVSELLREAKADAPPPRFDVDDVVTAGRRRRRRRNGGWTIAAAAAVAVAIGVPQIATHPDGPPAAVAPAVPSVSTPVTPPSTGRFVFAFPFRGYTAGSYRIADPSYMRISVTTTAVLRGTARVGSLRVFEPGVVPEVIYDGAQRKETAPVSGRPAQFLRKKGRSDLLAWEYADNAVAVLVPDTEADLSVADMRRIAEGLVVGERRAATVPFQLGHVPPDLRLLTVISRFGPEEPATLQLISDTMAQGMLRRPDRDLPPGVAPTVVTVSLTPPQPGADPPRKVTCVAEESLCTEAVGTKGHRIEVYGQGVSLDEIRKILAGVTPAADPDDVGTWFAANDAVPVFAQLPAQ